MPVPSPLPRRLEATMSTTDGSTLARMPFTSRAAPAIGPAVEPDAGAVADGEPGAAGIGVVVAPPDGAVALVTAGESSTPSTPGPPRWRRRGCRPPEREQRHRRPAPNCACQRNVGFPYRHPGERRRADQGTPRTPGPAPPIRAERGAARSGGGRKGPVPKGSFSHAVILALDPGGFL